MIGFRANNTLLGKGGDDVTNICLPAIIAQRLHLRDFVA